MPKIMTRQNRVGNFLKKEFWAEERWCRQQGTFTFGSVSDADLEAGLVITRAASATGAYAAVGNSVAATEQFAVILDNDLLDKVNAAKAASASTVAVDVLYRGQAVVRSGGLIFTGNSASKTNAILALEGKDIRVESRFSVKNA
jgi:hypothetical protein